MSARLLLAPTGVPARLVKALARLVAARPDALFPMLVVEAASVRPWSSATFDGERHRLDLRLLGSAVEVGDGLERLMAGLADLDFGLTGQIVAEAKLLAVGVDPDPLVVALTLAIEVLTVTD